MEQLSTRGATRRGVLACPLPSHVPTGAALEAIRLSEEAHGIRGLDVLRRSIDRAPPVRA